EAILYAAENPVRDLFAGGGGKALSFAEKYAPRITDKLMELWGFDSQKSDKPAPARDADGLHRPSGGGPAQGTYDGHVSKTSLYTKGSMHPLVAGGLVLAGVGVAYALAKGANLSHVSESSRA